MKRRADRYQRRMYLLLSAIIVILALLILSRDLWKYSYNREKALDNIPPIDMEPKNITGGQFKEYEDDKYYSLNGIDLSEHQSEVDFNVIKEQGIDFVYLRVGYRGYKTGSINIDRNFEKFYAEAKAANLAVGVYFFSQAVSVEEAIDEALFVKDQIKDKAIDLPIAYDLEDIAGDGSRIDDLTLAMRTENAMAFCGKIEDLGYSAMIYANQYWCETYYQLADILNYPLWLAQYNDYPTVDYPFKIWQYSDEGQLAGVDTRVDLNMMLVEK